MSGFIKVCSTTDIEPDSGVCLEFNGNRIAVFNLGGEFYAIDDTCTHNQASLAEGWVDGDEIECPWHGAHFSIKTGAVKSMPADVGVNTYPVKVEANEVFVCPEPRPAQE